MDRLLIQKQQQFANLSDSESWKWATTLNFKTAPIFLCHEHLLSKAPVFSRYHRIFRKLRRKPVGWIFLRGPFFTTMSSTTPSNEVGETSKVAKSLLTFSKHKVTNTMRGCKDPGLEYSIQLVVSFTCSKMQTKQFICSIQNPFLCHEKVRKTESFVLSCDIENPLWSWGKFLLQVVTV